MKWILPVASLLVCSLAAFTFFAFGGFDKFKAPVEVVLPVGFAGVVCAKVLAEVQESALPNPLRYSVDKMGRTAMPRNIVTSHRPRKVLVQMKDGTERELDKSLFGPVLTEYDAVAGSSVVYWVGSDEDWARFSSHHGHKPFCID